MEGLGFSSSSSIIIRGRRRRTSGPANVFDERREREHQLEIRDEDGGKLGASENSFETVHVDLVLGVEVQQCFSYKSIFDHGDHEGQDPGVD